MLQINDKKNIIIITAGIILILVVIVLFMLQGSDKKNIILPNEKGLESGQIRLMTDKEKEARGLDKNQVLQVINDKEGHFIYKVVK